MEGITEKIAKKRLIEYLENDVEICEMDMPKEFKYSEIDEFDRLSAEKSATIFLLEAVRNSNNVEKTVNEFANKMLQYMCKASTKTGKDIFQANYQVARWYAEYFYDIVADNFD